MYTDTVQKLPTNSESNIMRCSSVPRFKYLPIRLAFLYLVITFWVLSTCIFVWWAQSLLSNLIWLPLLLNCGSSFSRFSSPVWCWCFVSCQSTPLPISWLQPGRFTALLLTTVTYACYLVLQHYHHEVQLRRLFQRLRKISLQEIPGKFTQMESFPRRLIWMKALVLGSQHHS